jgi:hypothetical protein
VHGNLQVSLYNGQVYLYDVLTEVLRVLAVRKARLRSEDHGLFFQSRTAVALLTAMDAVLFGKLKDKWCVLLNDNLDYLQAR